MGPRTGLGPAAVLAIGSIIAVAFMGSVVVTPLYSLYRSKSGFSEIVPILVYAVYVVGRDLVDRPRSSTSPGPVVGRPDQLSLDPPEPGLR